MVLNDENVTWKLDKSSSDRILEDELECFRKDNYGLREGMIYVLVIYQKEKEEQNEMEIKYLYIGEIAKSNGVCNLEIN